MIVYGIMNMNYFYNNCKINIYVLPANALSPACKNMKSYTSVNIIHYNNFPVHNGSTSNHKLLDIVQHRQKVIIILYYI